MESKSEVTQQSCPCGWATEWHGGGSVRVMKRHFWGWQQSWWDLWLISFAPHTRLHSRSRCVQDVKVSDVSTGVEKKSLFVRMQASQSWSGSSASHWGNKADFKQTEALKRAPPVVALHTTTCAKIVVWIRDFWVKHATLKILFKKKQQKKTWIRFWSAHYMSGNL